THMDHFMGFDQLLRLFLARDATLRLYGPAGLADCVAGKLAGYTWNLTDEYAFALEVIEIGARETTSWRFAARQRFAREPLGPPRPFTGVVVADPVFTVEAAPLDHKIVSMAYAMTERTHLNVRREAPAAAIVRPAAGADLCFCEAPFLEEDLEQAARRYHLTARQAGALARAAGVRRLQVFHFSPRYEGRYGEIVSEAQAELAGQEVRYG